MEIFANIFEICKDDQNLEVIYDKFVDQLKKLEESVASKDTLKVF